MVGAYACVSPVYAPSLTATLLAFPIVFVGSVAVTVVALETHDG